MQPAVGRDVRRDQQQRGPVVGRTPHRDGVDGVLHQLADVHPRAGVQVVAQEVDDAAKVDLEGALVLTHA